jgi:diaminohydroxyphosphoribosylaminopyrimidine deaminase / 5-amino-6-(5-phosphoribosylamino)uracil reductase
MIHDNFMKRCLDLAILGSGYVAPNPLVGSVLVLGDIIIGEGYHTRYGKSHAEVNAINSVHEKSAISSSTLYVNLEPCSHIGKTPPCTDLILKLGIKKVVIANHDPNPLVNGKGIKILKQQGVNVVTNVLQNEGAFLNRRFFTWHLKKRPYIILKWAQSADGFIAPHKNISQMSLISNVSSRTLVHKWRSEEQAILIGKNTAIKDNSRLNVRLWKGNNPVRIVIDPQLVLPQTLNIYDGSQHTIIINYKISRQSEKIRFIKISPAKNIAGEVCNVLYNENLQSVIIEGGSNILNQFIESGYWDEARVFVSPMVIKKGIEAPVFHFSYKTQLDLNGDSLRFYYNQLQAL